MACIDSISIPLSLLPPGDLLNPVGAVGTLKGYAFSTERQRISQRSRVEIFFDIHPLVHFASMSLLQFHRKWMTWTTKAAVRLEELVPYGGHEGKDAQTAYRPHANRLAGLGDALDENRKASILDRAGLCQTSIGQYSIAEMTHRQVLASRSNSLGNEHPSMLKNMNNLAGVLRHQGKYQEAELMHKQMLVTRKKVLGVEHPATLTTMNNSAAVLGPQGKYQEAALMHRQMLVTSKKVLGFEHPDTLTTMDNLAGVLISQRKYQEVEFMQKQTLVIWKKVLGVEHPSMLTFMNNLKQNLLNLFPDIQTRDGSRHAGKKSSKRRRRIYI